MGKTEQSVTAEQVSEYLQENTDFLTRHPDLLTQLEFENAPNGTISLAQRQRQQLRENNKHLQDQLQALIANAKSNVALQQRVNKLCLTLMDCQTLTVLLETVVAELKRNFSADAVAVRLFYSEQQYELPNFDSNIEQLRINDPRLKVFDHLLGQPDPICGRLTQAQKNDLFLEQSESVQSVACIPIGHQPCIGLLAIASYDPNRFHANMGTEYLRFLSDVFLRLLRRFHIHHGE